MFSTVDELNNCPASIIVYPSGASGEFIAWALGQSVPAIADINAEWENNNRIIYMDFLGRNLNSGFDELNPQAILDCANRFVSRVTSDFYLIIAHPTDSSLAFIQQHLSNLPMIEITLKDPYSMEFSKRAAVGKIHKGTTANTYQDRPGTISYCAQRHLQVEWKDIILTNPRQEFERILKFLGLQGSADRFAFLVDDYVSRNQKYLNEV
jgi:hypothetical protein